MHQKRVEIGKMNFYVNMIQLFVFIKHPEFKATNMLKLVGWETIKKKSSEISGVGRVAILVQNKLFCQILLQKQKHKKVSISEKWKNHEHCKKD